MATKSVLYFRVHFPLLYIILYLLFTKKVAIIIETRYNVLRNRKLDKNSATSKWLVLFFGQSLLPSDEVGTAFAKEIMSTIIPAGEWRPAPLHSARWIIIIIIYLLKSTELEDAHMINTRTRAGQERHRKLALTLCPLKTKTNKHTRYKNNYDYAYRKNAEKSTRLSDRVNLDNDEKSAV